MSNLASSTDGAEDQSFRADEQPAQEQTIGPPENSGEKENGGLSAVKTPSMISNAGPSQPSERHEQESASKVVPDSDLASWAEKDRPTLGELAHIMEKVLDVLRNSTIAHNSDKDNRSSFWGIYKRVATEYDDQFLVRYDSDMSDILLISGLLSAASMSFIVTMESNLSPDPCDTTNALLAQLVQIGLGNLTAAGSMHADPASTWSPTVLAVRIQMFAYTSLSMSLLAAFGVILGKQWLGYYKSHRYGRGSLEEQGKRRQEMFNGLVTWYFDAVIQFNPILLQISLLLFGIALGANMWYQQPSIALVIISTTVFGLLFYSLTVMACLISPSCPFQTPTSMILCMLGTDKVLRPVFKRVFSCFQQPKTSGHGVLLRMLGTLGSSWTRFYEALAGPVYASGAFAQRSLQLLSAVLRKGLRSLAPRPSTKVGDSEAQPLDQDLDVLAEEESILPLDLRDISTSDLEAPSIKWLLETSTDPEVVLATAKLVPQVEWPLDLDVSDTLRQLSNIFASCVDIQGNIVPSLEKASACTTALTNLYYGRVLQAHPRRGNFIAREREDADVFWEIFRGGIYTTDRTVLHMTINLCSPDSYPCAPYLSEACPDSVLERLSHLLPYHFVTGRANTDIEDLAITVISKLLSSPSSPSPPSPQNIANCTLLACVMVGTQVDKKDIIRIDKSSFLPKLSGLLLAHFQKALWAWDGDELDDDRRRAWKLLGVICRILELAGYHDPSSHIMRNLKVCRNIYSRTKSPEQNDASALLVALRNVLHFTFAAANVSRDSAELWYASPFWAGDSHPPEDFDWMLDYLNDIYSDDHEAAYDVLLLLGSIRGSYNPAKHHMFIENLIACMNNNMPFHLRHAALRAAHGAREEIASIDAIDDARLREIVLINLSPAIMSVVCLHPSLMLANDDPDRFFDYNRDLCYLEIIFALARNSIWHPHLSQDRHIDRCISMIPKYCNSEYYSQHAFCIAGILLRISPEQTSDTSLDFVTEQQWWDVMRCAWYYLPYIIRKTHDSELLVFVERTKRYMQIASKSGLENLITNVDDVLDSMKLEMGLNTQDLEEEDAVTIAVKKLRDTARNMLESLVDVNNY